MQAPPSNRLLNRGLRTTVSQELQPSRLIPTITSGLITGVLLVIYSISMAALIFSGKLATSVSLGIGFTLITAIVTAVIVALTNSLPGVVTMPQDAPAIIVSMMASAIAAQFSDAAPALLPTVVMAIAITTMLVGLIYLLLGTFKLGNLTRFIPYPVIGGFLAGTGYLLAQGAFNVMTDHFFDLPHLSLLFRFEYLIRWLPGLGLAIALLILLGRSTSVFIMPGLIAGSILVFYLMLGLTQTSISEAREAGLLLQAFPHGGLWRPLHWSMFHYIDWKIIIGQAGNIATTVLLSVISLLLIATGIELASQKDVNLNQELRSAGIANLIAGLGGGIIGFQALGLSTLSCAKIGAKSRLVGILAATICLVTLLLGETLVALFPKPVLGGVALFLGLSFLVEWVYDAWFKLPRADYGIVVLILFVIATVGFLQGVAVGLVVSIARFVINYSQVNVTKQILSGATYQSNIVRSLHQERFLREEGDQIYILNLQGFLFFGTANALLNRIRDRLQDPNLIPLRFAVLNFRLVNGLDSSAVLSFIKLRQLFQQHDIKLVFTHLSSTIHSQLQRGGCLSPDDPVCHVFSDLDHGLGWCEDEILSQIPFRRGRSIPLVMQLKDLLPNHSHASALMDYLEEWDVDAGTIVFQQNQPVNALYLIEVGQATIYFEYQPGQTHRIQTLGAGNLVGELDFFRNSTHQTSAIVDAPSTLYRLSTASFHQLQQEQPEVAVAFQSAVIQVLGDRLTHAYKEISDLLKS
ncbi:MAG: SulP family inorganic anion transporter [Oculatellaceae cyanobacterium Prado106]|jgi:SulP family sulfate permease|nr:SulP family inorganic anion transporter [Oculatellaceae cyanobacterium Prado106]